MANILLRNYILWTVDTFFDALWGFVVSCLVLLSSRQTPSSTTSNAAAQLTTAVSEDCHGKEFGVTLGNGSLQYRQV